MKYLIFSDAHGDRNRFERIITRYQDNQEIEAIFYNGDSEFPPTDDVFDGIYSVTGNNDFPDAAGNKFNDENVYTSSKDEITFYQTHGHLTGANFGLDEMYDKALENNADIILFGHTHVLFNEMYQGKLFINPGSISLPRGRQANLGGTYAMLNVTNHDYLVEYLDMEGKTIDSLSRVYKRPNTL